uniref:CCHC-type domain-containing protein n=1 Tax=Tanacetum cinerariifolium TaxID=118510 RepID=A0A699JBY9_TANCI|nr:hypothetical protein [Tanacetum cinerariifolium]
MWDEVKRLMQGTEISDIDRELRFSNEFDQFTAAAEESLTFVYNHFSQLINDLQRSNVKLSNVTINTKFLNCLYPEWYKYVTNIRLAKNMKDDSYDMLYDHLQLYEKLVIASRAQKAAKTHDSLALVAHTSLSSSRSPPPYYVTHHSTMVDYDDDYRGNRFSDDQEDSLTSAMMLLAHEITQCYSTPTNNRLRTSSNTRNQVVVQTERVNIQRGNVVNCARIARRSYITHEESAESSNCYNCNAKGHYARDCPKPRVQDSKYFMEHLLLAKKDEARVILSNEQNDFLLVDATQME